jgi:hypothetical protein
MTMTSSWPGPSPNVRDSNNADVKINLFSRSWPHDSGQGTMTTGLTITLFGNYLTSLPGLLF